MADWTTLSNGAVGVGGLPSGTTVTALRDNPVAIAEAAAGAPRLVGTARRHNLLAEATNASEVTEISITDLDPHTDVMLVTEGFERGVDNVSISLGLQVSIDNGSNWTQILSSSISGSNNRSLTRVFAGWGDNRSFAIGTTLSQGSVNLASLIFSLSGQINAVRVARISGDGVIGIGANLKVYGLAEGYL